MVYRGTLRGGNSSYYGQVNGSKWKIFSNRVSIHIESVDFGVILNYQRKKVVKNYAKVDKIHKIRKSPIISPVNYLSTLLEHVCGS